MYCYTNPERIVHILLLKEETAINGDTVDDRADAHREKLKPVKTKLTLLYSPLQPILSRLQKNVCFLLQLFLSITLRLYLGDKPLFTVPIIMINLQFGGTTFEECEFYIAAYTHVY